MGWYQFLIFELWDMPVFFRPEAYMEGVAITPSIVFVSRVLFRTAFAGAS